MSKLLFLILFCFLFVPASKADTVTITSGQFFSTGGSFPTQTWSFAGNNFSTSGSNNEGGGISPTLIPCSSNPCGAVQNFLLSIALSGAVNVSVTYNGFSASGDFFHPVGNQMFGTVPFQIPTGVLGNITVTAPFTSLAGSVSVFDPFLLGGADPFTVSFVGSGTATANFFLFQVQEGSPINLQLNSVTLTFAEPVPEAPTSILMISGLAMLGVLTITRHGMVGVGQ